MNFAEENGNVRLELSADNLTPGEHAVHLHEKGDCSAEDASSAGGHWNPAMKPHGKRGGGGSYHKGDIGNMTVGNDGKGKISLVLYVIGLLTTPFQPWISYLCYITVAGIWLVPDRRVEKVISQTE